MSESDLKTAMGTAAAGCFLAVCAIVLGLLVMLGAKDENLALKIRVDALTAQVDKLKPCQCQPAPTPVACCDSKSCKQELAQVDARFGDVWDDLVEVQEQLAKVKPCSCEPSKPCACSDKPACECKPAETTPPAISKPSSKSKQRILKRCK